MATARAAYRLDTLLANALAGSAGEATRRVSGQRLLSVETLESRIAPSSLLSMPFAAPRPVAVDGVDALEEISVAPGGATRRSLNEAKRDVGAATFALPPVAPDWFKHAAERDADNLVQHRRHDGKQDATPRDRERVGRALRSGMSDLSVDLSAWAAPREQQASAAKSPVRNLLLQQPTPWHNSSAPSAIGGGRGDVGGGSVGGRSGVPAASVIEAGPPMPISVAFLEAPTDYPISDPANSAPSAINSNGVLSTGSSTALSADGDGDGEVSGNDFLLWQRTLGATAEITAGTSVAAATSTDDMGGDFNGDMKVDSVDLSVWMAQFAGEEIAAQVVVNQQLSGVPNHNISVQYDNRVPSTTTQEDLEFSVIGPGGSILTLHPGRISVNRLGGGLAGQVTFPIFANGLNLTVEDVALAPGRNEFSSVFTRTDTNQTANLSPNIVIIRNQLPVGRTGTVPVLESSPGVVIALEVGANPNGVDADGDSVDAVITTLPVGGTLRQFDTDAVIGVGDAVTDPQLRVRFVPVATSQDVNTSVGFSLSDGFESAVAFSFSIQITNVQPAAPQAPVLLPETDTKGPFTGSSLDRVTTARPDGGMSERLKFSISGIEPGATVQLLSSGAVVNATLVADSDNDGIVIIEDTSDSGIVNGVFAYTAQQTDVGGKTSVESLAEVVFIDQAGPGVSSIRLHPDDAVVTGTVPSQPVTESQNPRIRFEIVDESFQSGALAPANDVSVQVLVDGTLNTPTPVVTSFSTSNSGARTLEIALNGLAPGRHTAIVRAIDAAGNVSDTSFVFFVSQVGDATIDSPGTPVFTTTYFLGAKLIAPVAQGTKIIDVDVQIPTGFALSIDGANYRVMNSTALPSGGFRLTLNNGVAAAFGVEEKVSWLRPWTNAFDNTTQTIWFTMEDGHRLGHFDPATGEVEIFDVNFQGGTSTSAYDPHGVFFDFNTHLTPRIWFVYRNVGNDNDTPTGAAPNTEHHARLAYLDLVTRELVTFDFAELHVEGTHNIRLDDTGNVWISAEDSNEVIEIDFDFKANGDRTSSINSREGRIIRHTLPEELGGSLDFRVHGLEIVVDERNGERFVYLSDASAANSPGRIVLLKPGAIAKGAQPATKDQWFEWNLDPVLIAEGRLSATEAPDAHMLFIAIDDRETPGIPEDDRIVVGDSGQPRNPEGAIRFLEAGNLIRALQNGGTIPNASRIDSVRIPGIPGADLPWAATVQTFVDREGQTFFLDAVRGVGRLHLDDSNLERGETLANFDASITHLISDELNPVFDIAMTATSGGLTSVVRSVVGVDLTGPVYSDDQSQLTGVDQYEVAAEVIRGRNGNEGVFRGALNATNVLYGSIAQSDHLSTTVFAETSRRQMAVVPSPTAGNLAIRGRMAFQVLRDGSLILTARGDGSLLDKQMNLSDRLKAVAPPFSAIAIDGDPTAIVDGQGRVNVLARTASGDLVHFRYMGAWNSTDGLFDPTRWTVNVIDVPNGNLLAGEPVAFAESATKLAIFATTAEGHLLRHYLGEAMFVDLTEGKPGFEVYASPGIVRQGNDVFVYASNQKGDLIEYSYAAGASAAVARVVAATPFAAPAGGAYQQQSARDVRVFQDIEVVLDNGVRHVYATDGNSRLVHIEANGTRAGYAENVSQLVANSLEDNTIDNETTTVTTGGVTREVVTQTSMDIAANDQAFGQFPFQEPYVGRVYSGLEVLVGSDGRHFIYGTEGSSLILFIRGGGQPDDWRVSNLTNDTYSIYGDAGDRTDSRAPAARVPANAVFGSPGGYIEDNGDRHIFQINAEGEVVEYYIVFNQVPSGSVARFHTQNINLRTGFSPTELLHQA
jgi:hypothetical protein